MGISFITLSSLVLLLTLLSYRTFARLIPCQYTPLIAHPTNSTYPLPLYQSNIFIPLTARFLDPTGETCDGCDSATRIRSISVTSTATENTKAVPLTFVAITTFVQVIDADVDNTLLHEEILAEIPTFGQPEIPSSFATVPLNWGSSIYLYKLPIYITIQVLFQFPTTSESDVAPFSSSFQLELRGTAQEPLILNTDQIKWQLSSTIKSVANPQVPNIVLSQLPVVRSAALPSRLQHDISREVLDPYRLGRFHFAINEVPLTIVGDKHDRLSFSLTFTLVGPYTFVPIDEPLSHIFNNHNKSDYEREVNPYAQYRFLPHYNTADWEAQVSRGPFCMINQWYPFHISQLDPYRITLDPMDIDLFVPPRYRAYTTQGPSQASLSVICYNVAVSNPTKYRPAVLNSLASKLYGGLNVVVEMTTLGPKPRGISNKVQNLQPPAPPPPPLATTAFISTTAVYNFNIPESQLFFSIAPSSFDCLKIQGTEHFIRCLYHNPFENDVNSMSMLLQHVTGTTSRPTIGMVYQFGTENLALSGEGNRDRNKRPPLSYMINDMETSRADAEFSQAGDFSRSTWNTTLHHNLVSNHHYYDVTAPIVIDLVVLEANSGTAHDPFTLMLNSSAIAFRIFNDTTSVLSRDLLPYFIPYTFHNNIKFGDQSQTTNKASFELFSDEFFVQIDNVKPKQYQLVDTDGESCDHSSPNQHYDPEYPFASDDDDLIFYFLLPQRLFQFDPHRAGEPQCDVYTGDKPAMPNDQALFIPHTTISFRRFTNDLTFDIRDSYEVFAIHNHEYVPEPTPESSTVKATSTIRAKVFSIDTPNDLKSADFVKVVIPQNAVSTLGITNLHCNFGLVRNPKWSHNFIPHLSDGSTSIPSLVSVVMLKNQTLSNHKSPFSLTTRTPYDEFNAVVKHRIIFTTVSIYLLASLIITLIVHFFDQIRALSRKLFPCCYTDYVRKNREQQYIDAQVHNLNLQTVYAGDIPPQLHDQTALDESSKLQDQITQLSEYIQLKHGQQNQLKDNIFQQQLVETHVDPKLLDPFADKSDDHIDDEFTFSQPRLRNKKGIYPSQN